jgi:NAD+-dependent secondary alcohol dehydrogenase Adh1
VTGPAELAVRPEALLRALETVRDPELDEPITTLGFVASCTVSGGGQAQVRLRLPTYFCAPNFAFLMVADAYDALAGVPGVRSAEVILEDHFAGAQINAGVAAQAGFVGSFRGEAVAELAELRANFLRKAVMAGTDLVCRPLLAHGSAPEELREMTLGDVPPSADLTKLRQRRGELGLPAGDDAPLLIDPVTGERVTPDAVPLHLRRARVTRAGIEANTSICSGMLAHRYPGLSRLRGGTTVKAVRLHKFHTAPTVDEIPEPKITGPLDVIVKIGGAGVCRTDLHIIEGQWDAAMGTPLPYVLGHENAGWVHEVGAGVTNVSPGDTVILHPLVTCGLCRACRAGDDMHCVNSAFPGLSRDGGMAEYLLTSARACVKLDPATRPEDVAALADAGITAYHAVRKAIPLLYPGTTCVVIGAGGLGHIGIQCLAELTAARIIVVDRNADALKLAEQLGADATVVADGKHVDAVKQLTGGPGAEVVLDFVAEQGAEMDGWAMTREAGSYFVIGYGGTLHIPTLDIISTERNIVGNIVGTYNDLAELMALAQAGKVTLHTRTYPLDAAPEALADLDAGRVRGRAILVP